MKTLEDLFRNLRRLDLSQQEVQDSLYRISDWLSGGEHTEQDSYVQNQLEFLYRLIVSAEKQELYFSSANTKIVGH